GECVLRHMGGYANPEEKIPKKCNEKYHIYSCSKLITCAAAMQLWEKGMFSLDDNLSDYLPAFKEMTVKTADGIKKAKNPIKINHLFEMTSGISYDMHTPELEAYYNIPGNNTPTVETVNMFARTPLEFEPGEKWLYGLNHDVLGALIETISGEKFEDYVKKHIFEPLGMENSSFLHPIEDWEGFARQYTYEDETGKFLPTWRFWCHLGKEFAGGGGGCVSTVEDYIKFLEAMRTGGVILKKETIELMATDRLTEEQRKTYVKNSPDVGYGLGMRTPRGNPKCMDFGWDGAAGAYAAVDHVNNITIYYAQHVLNSPKRHLRSWFYNTVRADLLGEKVDVPFEEINGTPWWKY
ncbi:MAG: beta-lactamase family protein, partial [Clostridia bacterium]|nr:beta-lactamase family protein [Clostridia bacterium]